MKNVLEFLEGTVSKYPERYAVEDENICFTWRELQEYARKIGSFLCKEGKAGSPVAIVAEKGVFTLAAMLGAAYAGDFYDDRSVAAGWENAGDFRSVKT